MKARYDLASPECPATFDFFTWLTHVRVLGATEVVFGVENIRTTKWNEAEVRRRLESILIPGVALADMDYSIGAGGERCGSHLLKDMAVLVGRGFSRLTSVKPRGRERYTVTLRRTSGNAFRNSNESVWRQFAKDIGAFVIEDYAQKAIHLHDRMALYAGAEMNFGVNNGPIGMLLMTPYPVMIFDCLNCQKSLADQGIAKGEQVLFALPHQRLVWSDQSLGALHREFDARKSASAAVH